MSAIAPKPEGTGLSGRSALSRRSPVGPATGVASLRASHPGKPPSRPRGTYSEVPWPPGSLTRRLRAFELLPQQHAFELGRRPNRENSEEREVWQILTHRLAVHTCEVADDLASGIEHRNSDVAVSIEFLF